MQITLLGIVLVPLSLLWGLRPVRLLQLALIAGVFEAAAALVLGGSFGLQPALVPGLLFMAYIVAQYALGMRYPGEAAALWGMWPLLLLLAYAGLSIYLLPAAFAGRIMVWPQRVDELAPGLVPLAFSFGNVTQTLYLAMDILFTILVAIFVTSRAIPYERIIAAYLAGGYLVVGLVFWQLANSLAGVPYPDELLHSNPGWAIVAQSFGSVPRLQGPFTEPAGLAVYMSGVSFCCLWLTVRGWRTMRPNLLLPLAITSTLLSTSTTGIVTIVVGLPLVLTASSVGGDPGALRRIGRTMATLLLGGALLLAPILILRPSLLDAVNTVLQATLTKGDSDSYVERSGVDAAAYSAMEATYGLGVGWGSFRAMSLLPGLLANGGVFCVAMLVWLFWRVRALARRARRAAAGHPGQILVDGFSAALCGQLAASSLSSPMITSLVFYVQLGCVVGVLARITAEPHGRAAQPLIL